MKANEDYQKLLNNNRQWVKDKLAQDENFFKKLSDGQKPRFLWIGCSDSRVPANEITGTDPGEIFVHRNVANLVVHTDINLLSVLDYAVKVLKVEHVLVVGHYGCGGVLAAMGNHHYGLIDNWLRNIKDVYRLHQTTLNLISDENVRARLMVELNVREQVLNLCKTSTVQEAWDKGETLNVHGWVYDLGNGIIKSVMEMPAGAPLEHEIYAYDNLDVFS